MDNSVFTMINKDKKWKIRYKEQNNCMSNFEYDLGCYKWNIFINSHDICSMANIDNMCINKYKKEEFQHTKKCIIEEILCEVLPRSIANYIVFLNNGIYFKPETCVILLLKNSSKMICDNFLNGYNILCKTEIKQLQNIITYLEKKRDFLCEEYYYEINDTTGYKYNDFDFFINKQKNIELLDDRITITLHGLEDIQESIIHLKDLFNNYYKKNNK